MASQRFVRQTFRKATKTPEELQAERAEILARERAMRKRRGDPTLASIYGTGSRTGAPVLLIDGYNLLGHHAKLRVLRATSLEQARERLEVILSDYAATVNTAVAVVWDAMGRQDTQCEAGLSSVPGRTLMSIYTTATEADTFIVRAVRVLLRAGAEYVLVATADVEEGDLARDVGGYVIKCEQLMTEVSRARRDAAAELRLSQEHSTALGRSQSLGSLLGQVQIGDEAKAAEFNAMLQRFNSAHDREEAGRLGMRAHEFYAWRRRQERAASRAASALSDSGSDGSDGSSEDSDSADEELSALEQYIDSIRVDAKLLLRGDSASLDTGQSEPDVFVRGG